MGVYTGIIFLVNHNLEDELRSSVTEERIQEIENETLNLIEITEERISDELTNDFNILKTLALTLAKPLSEGDLDSVTWIYTSLNTMNPTISGIWVVNSSDIIVAGSPHPYFPIGKNISNDIVHQAILGILEEGYNKSTFPLITFNPWFVGGSDNDEYGMGYDKIANLNKPVEINIEGEVQLTANPADKTSQYRSGRPDVIYRKL